MKNLEITFKWITFDQLDDIARLHPLTLADETHSPSHLANLKSCPDIVDDFPIFFYLTQGDHIVSSIACLPDTMITGQAAMRWAWGGSLETNVEYRGKGMASFLVKNMVDFLHRGNIGWGAVFSTPQALSIYRKLGFTLPGFAKRYLFLRTSRPFLNKHVTSQVAIDAMDFCYRILARTWSYVHSWKSPRKVSVERVSLYDESVTGQLPPLKYSAKYHFNDTYLKLMWKIRNDMQFYIVRSRSSGQPLCYFLTKSRIIEKPLASRYCGFDLMTLMDYGFYTDVDDIACSILITAFWDIYMDSGADILEIITSLPALCSAAKRHGMIKVGNGMSFKFSVPAEWNIGPDASDIRSWHLTHCCGDAFSFE